MGTTRPIPTRRVRQGATLLTVPCRRVGMGRAPLHRPTRASRSRSVEDSLDFYSVSAQVFPLLWILLVVEFHFYEPSVKVPFLGGLVAVVGGTFLLALGEAASLSALLDGPSAGIETQVKATWLSLALLVLGWPIWVMLAHHERTTGARGWLISGGVVSVLIWAVAFVAILLVD